MDATKFVLVVEDDDDIREMIVSTLKAESADMSLVVVEAKDGREAIHFAGRQEFNCVITDLNMPKTTGQELIKVLMGDAMNANTPTVVVSAGINDHFLAEFRGVRTMSKPFDPVVLSQTVMREIKLGRMDERVPVHLINPFAEAMRDLLKLDVEIETTLVSPTVRRAGDPLAGDLSSLVTLTTGMVQGRLCFSFDKSFLLKMKTAYFSTRRSQWSAMSLELLVKQTLNVLIERAQPALASVFGSNPRTAEIVVHDLTDPVRAAEASKPAGVTVALKTEQGCIYISALAPLKSRRGHA